MKLTIMGAFSALHTTRMKAQIAYGVDKRKLTGQNAPIANQMNECFKTAMMIFCVVACIGSWELQELEERFVASTQ